MDITVQELKQKLDNKEQFIFIDVREPWEYDEFNLGAKLMPLSSLPNRVSELQAYINDEIVLHCRTGKRSGAAQFMLQAQGFSNVRSTLGGVLAWKEAFA